MPWRCDNEDCAGEGCFFEETCPGSQDSSEDERHHCSDCGWLWNEDKCITCCYCGDYWCPDYQEVCVYITCPYVGERLGNEEYACPTCFLSKKNLWCTVAKCRCHQKEPEVRSKWTEFNTKGHLSGEITMDKETEPSDIWNACVFECYGRTKFRLEYSMAGDPAETKLFSNKEQLRRFVRRLLKAKLNEGFTLSKLQGLFAEIKIKKRLRLKK